MKSGEPLLLSGAVSEEGDLEAKTYRLRLNEVQKLATAREEKVRKVRIRHQHGKAPTWTTPSTKKTMHRSLRCMSNHASL